jgi:hypothetical protein
MSNTNSKYEFPLSDATGSSVLYGHFSGASNSPMNKTVFFTKIQCDDLYALSSGYSGLCTTLICNGFRAKLNCKCIA